MTSRSTTRPPRLHARSARSFIFFTARGACIPLTHVPDNGTPSSWSCCPSSSRHRLVVRALTDCALILLCSIFCRSVSLLARLVVRRRMSACPRLRFYIWLLRAFGCSAMPWRIWSVLVSHSPRCRCLMLRSGGVTDAPAPFPRPWSALPHFVRVSSLWFA